MTAVEAAVIIGCSPSTVRLLIRSGVIKCKTIPIPGGKYYDISHREAERVRDLPKDEKRGFPRGKKRTPT